MSTYKKDAAREHSMWRVLTTAACGRIVCAICFDERDADRTFYRYVAALESAGLEGAAWSARKANGSRAIRFGNGGEVRFVSHQSQHLHGTRAGAVVMVA